MDHEEFEHWQADQLDKIHLKEKLERIRTHVQEARNDAQKRVNSDDADDFDVNYWVGVRNMCDEVIELIDGKKSEK